jgi:hypothetical protein
VREKKQFKITMNQRDIIINYCEILVIIYNLIYYLIGNLIIIILKIKRVKSHISNLSNGF